MKIFNPTLKRRETILFLLIVVINGLKCIVSDIGLDTCTRGKWKVEVSKLEINQRKSALVTKFSQPRAWISLKRASVAPQSKLCCIILFFILIIFRSIIQFLVVLFPLLLWLHQHILIYLEIMILCIYNYFSLLILIFFKLLLA